MKRGTTGLFCAGFLQGAAFVLLPSLGSLLEHAPDHFTSAAYGILYFPEIIGAILSAWSARFIHRRFGDRSLFRLGITCNILGLALLTAAYFAIPKTAYDLILADSIFLGVGFGLTSTALNHLAAMLFSHSATRAITLLNAVIGGATALSPLILGLAAHPFGWYAWPLALLIAWLVLFLLPTAEPSRSRTGVTTPQRFPVLAVLAVLIYAIVEGSFGSWASVFVSVNRHLTAAWGAIALSSFWASMTLARIVLGSLPDRILSRRATYLAAPFAIAACFLTLPWLNTAWALVAVFALAGIATSIYYPYSMAYALSAAPGQSTYVAGLLVAALMTGEGIGSFGLGPLQKWVNLPDLYLLSSLWAIPLLILAWHLSRPERTVRPGHQTTGSPHLPV